jgi:hypothetical protein
LSVAERPAIGCEVAGEDSDFSHEWVGHGASYDCEGKMPNNEMMKLMQV